MPTKTKKTAHCVERAMQFPMRCAECGTKGMHPHKINSYRAEVNHDGRMHVFDVQKLAVIKCNCCGEMLFTLESDRQISIALRTKLRLLTPDQIATNIKALKLTQKKFAERLGVAAESVCRWAGGSMIQSRAMDNLMRSYFGCPQVRVVLERIKRNPRFGQSVVHSVNEDCPEYVV